MSTILERGENWIETAGGLSNEQLHAALHSDNLGFDVPTTATESKQENQESEASDEPNENAQANVPVNATIEERAENEPTDQFTRLKRLWAEQAALSNEQRTKVPGSPEWRKIEARIQEIGKETFALQQTYVEEPERMGPHHPQQVIAGLHRGKEYREARHSLYEAFTNWRSETERLEDLGLLPGSAGQQLSKLDKEAGQCTCADELVKLNRRRGELSSVSHAEITAAQSLLVPKRLLVAERFASLLDIIDAELDELHANAINEEVEFFRAHGLPHAETMVSRRFADAKRLIAQQRGAVESLRGNDRLPGSATRVWAIPGFVGEDRT